MDKASAAQMLPPSEEQIRAYALACVAAFPDAIRALAAEVAIIVQDFPTEEMLSGLGIDDPFELTGLYDGTPVTEKSFADPAPHPDTVWLFRRPILDEWIERGEEPLDALVAHVTIHEFAHHFGWSDEAIAEIAPWQE